MGKKIKEGNNRPDENGDSSTNTENANDHNVENLPPSVSSNDSSDNGSSSRRRNSNPNADENENNNLRRRRPPTNLSSTPTHRPGHYHDGGKNVRGRGGGEGKLAQFNSNASRASRDTMSTASVTVGSLGTASMMGGLGLGVGGRAMGIGSGGGSRRRGGRRRSNNGRPTSRNMFNRQLQLLATTSGGSVIMFLFFFLNIFAFSALMMGFASTLMIFYTMYNYATYVLGQGDGALFDLLPSGVQEYLSNTSLHEAMTSNESFLENRWYLLYFIPGLTPEQINAMVNRLPERHRNMAHGPGGAARLFLPDSMYRLITPPNARSSPAPATTPSLIAGQEQQSHPQQSLMLTDGLTNRTESLRASQSGQHQLQPVGSIPLDNHVDPSLTVIIEDDDEDLEEEEVTMQDAFQGLLHSARALVTGGNNEQQLGASGEIESDISYDDDHLVQHDMSWDSQQEPRNGSRGGAEITYTASNETDGFVSHATSNSNIISRDDMRDMSWDDSHDEIDIDEVCDNHSAEEVQVEVSVDLDDDSDASDLGLDIEESDFFGGMNDGQLNRLARYIRLPFGGGGADQSNEGQREELEGSPIRIYETERRQSQQQRQDSQTGRSSQRRPSPQLRVPPGNIPPSTVVARTRHIPPLSSLPFIPQVNDEDEQTIQTLEEQQEIESDILNEAISTMINNYANTATTSAMSVASSIIETVAPTVIRLGASLSSISSIGLLGFYSSTRMNPINIGGRRLSTNARTERNIISGLASTIVFGAFSVGTAYAARSYMRRTYGLTTATS
eukprot:CAMPEP_0194081906 /NCGR_PEP_ID=MMETSP0149-20130528/7560_1 /TAXON_ID=122233 /ORGANISM="Chaetoceros debilis, Strain MM31A-1" /LENGTH=784 /DNA_ID=CAMNT_0038763925 /DNA_START=58 /DNA_END=2409 /DNA_ORIENTATION=+